MLSKKFGNGYGRGSNSNASLPSNIKCNGACGRVKPPGSFSAKQLEILQKKMCENPRLNPIKESFIPCTSCTSQQVVELECQSCDRWMSLDKFTKVQRKNPDNAECIQCTNERLNVEPHEVGRDDDEEEFHGSHQGGYVSRDEDDSDDNLVDGATGSMSNMSITNGPSTYPSQNGGSSTHGRGGVTVTSSNAPTSHQADTSVAGTTSTARTARSKFDPSKYGGSAKSSGGAWAKVPAGPRKPATKVGSDDNDDDRQIFDDSD